jgi:protein SCO1/2
MQIKMNRYYFYSVAISLLLAGCYAMPAPKQEQLPYYTSADFTPRWLKNENADTIHRIPDFSFTDQLGKTVSLKTFDNKITVVDFFFTSCPGICKKLTKNLSTVQETFRQDDNVLILSHSVTPEHDSVALLQAYAQFNHIDSRKWKLVTGNKSQIYKIARNAYFADEDLGFKQDSTTFLHTENVLLIDKQHHIRGIYKGTIPSEIENLIMDIKKLEASE